MKYIALGILITLFGCASKPAVETTYKKEIRNSKGEIVPEYAIEFAEEIEADAKGEIIKKKFYYDDDGNAWVEISERMANGKIKKTTTVFPEDERLSDEEIQCLIWKEKGVLKGKRKRICEE